MKRGAAIISAALLMTALALVHTVHAAMRVFEFRGTITQSRVPGVSVGDSFLATLAYDDRQLPAVANEPSQALYSGFSFVVTVFPSNATYYSSPISYLAMSITAPCCSGSFGIAARLGYAGFEFDGSGPLFTSTALPTSLSPGDFSRLLVYAQGLQPANLVGPFLVTGDGFQGFTTSITLLKKVSICHNGHTISTSINALQTHLDHGDLLGGCSGDYGSSKTKNVISYPSKAENGVAEIPNQFSLGQNYPNPFNPTTTIRFTLPLDSKVTLAVYDMLGRRVADLVNGEIAAGTHEVSFNASYLASGMYIYRLAASSTDGKAFIRELKLSVLK